MVKLIILIFIAIGVFSRHALSSGEICLEGDDRTKMRDVFMKAAFPSKESVLQKKGSIWMYYDHIIKLKRVLKNWRF